MSDAFDVLMSTARSADCDWSGPKFAAANNLEEWRASAEYDPDDYYECDHCGDRCDHGESLMNEFDCDAGGCELNRMCSRECLAGHRCEAGHKLCSECPKWTEDGDDKLHCKLEACEGVVTCSEKCLNAHKKKSSNHFVTCELCGQLKNGSVIHQISICSRCGNPICDNCFHKGSHSCVPWKHPVFDDDE
jgi:hypothetical protein